MLVKFLSFIASVLGTARYKAVVLSCLVLTLSFASIAGMALWHGSGQQSAASKLEQSETQADEQKGSPQVGGSSKQTIQDNQASETQASGQQSAGTASSENTESTNTTDPEDTAASKPLTITFDKASVTVPAGGKSGTITAKAPLPEKAQWKAAIVDTVPGLEVVAESQTTSGFVFHIQAKQDVDKNRSYEMILQILDADQTTVLATKSIFITIQ